MPREISRPPPVGNCETRRHRELAWLEHWAFSSEADALERRTEVVLGGQRRGGTDSAGAPVISRRPRTPRGPRPQNVSSDRWHAPCLLRAKGLTSVSSAGVSPAAHAFRSTMLPRCNPESSQTSRRCKLCREPSETATTKHRATMHTIRHATRSTCPPSCTLCPASPLVQATRWPCAYYPGHPLLIEDGADARPLRSLCLAH